MGFRLITYCVFIIAFSACGDVGNGAKFEILVDQTDSIQTYISKDSLRNIFYNIARSDIKDQDSVLFSLGIIQDNYYDTYYNLLYAKRKTKSAYRKRATQSINRIVDTIMYQLDRGLNEYSDQSHIYAATEAAVQRLNESTAKNKYIFIFSDMLQNRNEDGQFSFYDYREVPKLLGNDSLYKHVFKTCLQKVKPFPRMDGINVKIFLLVKENNRMISVHANRYWQRLFSELGCKSIELQIFKT